MANFSFGSFNKTPRGKGWTGQSPQQQLAFLEDWIVSCENCLGIHAVDLETSLNCKRHYPNPGLDF